MYDAEGGIFEPFQEHGRPQPGGILDATQRNVWVVIPVVRRRNQVIQARAHRALRRAQSIEPARNTCPNDPRRPFRWKGARPLNGQRKCWNCQRAIEPHSDLFGERDICVTDEPEGQMKVGRPHPRDASVWSTVRNPPCELIDQAGRSRLNVRTELDGYE